MKDEILKLIQETAEEIHQVRCECAFQSGKLTACEDKIAEMAPELEEIKKALENAETTYLKAREEWEKTFSEYYEYDNSRLNALSQVSVLQRKRNELESKRFDLFTQLAVLEAQNSEKEEN